MINTGADDVPGAAGSLSSGGMTAGDWTSLVGGSMSSGAGIVGNIAAMINMGKEGSQTNSHAMRGRECSPRLLVYYLSSIRIQGQRA